MLDGMLRFGCSGDVSHRGGAQHSTAVSHRGETSGQPEASSTRTPDGMVRLASSGDVSHRRPQVPSLAPRQTSPIGGKPKANRKLRQHECSTVWCDWAARETSPIQPCSAQPSSAHSQRLPERESPTVWCNGAARETSPIRPSSAQASSASSLLGTPLP